MAKTTKINNVSKEETTMKNMSLNERLIAMDKQLAQNPKTSDDGYVKKDTLAKFLYDNHLVEKNFSTKELRSIKRQELVEILSTAVHNLVAAGRIDVETIADVPVAEAKATAKEQYSLFCYFVKTNAQQNKDKGYGYCVSAYMLCAHVLKAAYGLKKLKGNEDKVTNEQREKVKEVRNFMIHKGHLKPVTWSYNNVTYYSPEYDGNNKNFMVPIEKAPKDAKLAVTTYKVMW